MFLIISLFVAAISIECIGSLISVIGLAAAFAADPIILVMAVILDCCKIIAVNVLAKKWHHLGKAIKTYLISATLVLMLITSGGIAGYLSGSFQKAMVPNDGNTIGLVNLQSEQSRLLTRKNEIDSQISQLPSNNVRGRERLISNFKEETDYINTRLVTIDADLPKMQQNQSKMSSEIGSILFFAKVFDVTPAIAVAIIIGLIVFVFDPLSIVFLITGNTLWAAYKNETDKELADLRAESAQKPILWHLEDSPDPHLSSSHVEKDLQSVELPIAGHLVQMDWPDIFSTDQTVAEVSDDCEAKPTPNNQLAGISEVGHNKEPDDISVTPAPAVPSELTSEPECRIKSAKGLRALVHQEIKTLDFVKPEVVKPGIKTLDSGGSEVVAQEVVNPEVIESLLNDSTLNNMSGSNVAFVGEHWINPKLREIYSD